MIRARILRSAARALLGTLIAAYAMVSMNVAARAPQVPDGPAPEVQAPAAAESATDEHSHCHPPPAEPAPLLCKYHCQSVVQTLDHPDARVAAFANHQFVVVAMIDMSSGGEPASRPRGRPDRATLGGAPPPYQSTARLRI